MAITRIGKGGKIEQIPDSEASGIHVQVSYHQGLEAEIEKRLGASSSSGAQWLLELRRQQSGFILPIDLKTEGLWFIKKLALAEVDEIGVAMASEGYGLREISNIEVRASFSKALLFVGVCEGEDNPSRKFANVGESGIFYAEARGLTALIARTLRDQLLLLNPVFVIEDEDGKKKVLEPNDFL